MISCVSGTVNIRTGNGTQYSRITAAKNGDTFEWVATAENGWHAVVVNGCVGWVSGKYSKAQYSFHIGGWLRLTAFFFWHPPQKPVLFSVLRDRRTIPRKEVPNDSTGKGTDHPAAR